MRRSIMGLHPSLCQVEKRPYSSSTVATEPNSRYYRRLRGVTRFHVVEVEDVADRTIILRRNVRVDARDGDGRVAVRSWTWASARGA